MARSRIELHELLVGILSDIDSSYVSDHCYFRPPARNMNYPCILYDFNTEARTYADNLKYVDYNRYDVTVIDTEVDSEIAEKVSELPYCSLNRIYNMDDLQHYVFTLYF